MQIFRKKLFVKRGIIFLLASLAWLSPVHSHVESADSVLTQYVKAAKQWMEEGGTTRRGDHADGVKNLDASILKFEEQLKNMEEGIRKTTMSMAFAQASHLKAILALLSDAQGNACDKLNSEPSTYFYQRVQSFKNGGTTKLPDRVALGKFIDDEGGTLTVDKGAGVAVASTEPPTALFSNNSKTTQSFRYHSKELLLKIAFSPKNKEAKQLEATVYGMAESLLPDKLLDRFDSQAVVSYLLGKAGIQRFGSRVTIRPSVPQDEFYVKYANIDCHPTDEVLFWADPMTTEGYHPLFGTALNKTVLKGCKQIDMDNVTSRGYSLAIDKWNRLQPPEKRIANPFKGYAAKVIPGLVEMSRQGRLTPGEPTDGQLTEALQLSKTIKILPSQKLAKKVSFSPLQYAAQGEKESAVQIIFIGDPRASESGAVSLDDHQIEVHKTSMAFDITRMEQIANLTQKNIDARNYLDRIIKEYVALQQGLAGVANSMNGDNAIPQITQLRQQVFESIGNCRKIISRLHQQQNDMEQQRWKILLHVLATKEASCQKLMENASCTLNSFRTMNAFNKTP